MQKKFKLFSILLIITLLFSLIPAAVFGAEDDPATTRIYGIDRYQTALEVAKTGWPQGSETVILAPGNNANLVDALTAAPLAKAEEAPIILTDKGKLPETVKQYLQLKTKKVIVVSGAVSNAVINELKSMEIEVTNLGGADRFATASNIAKELKDVSGVFITTAYSNADALSVASIAAAEGMPILLTHKDALPAVVTAYLEEIKDSLTKSYIIGGLTVVSDAVKEAVPGTVTRISGNDRYATNLEVLNAFFKEAANYQKVFVANGSNNHLVDALVASSLAAGSNSPILLVNKEFDVNSDSFLSSKLAPTSTIIAIGGEVAVSKSVETYNFLRAQDFGVMQFSGVNGYNVGFILPDADKVSAVEVSLYKGNALLAKNVSTNKLFSLGGQQFSSPFNINGDFAGDTYWRYGDWNGTVHDVPTKAVITAYLSNGQSYTVENKSLTGSPADLLKEDEKHIKAEDFGVMQFSGVNGYSVGFSLIDGKNAGDLASLEVSLYDQDGNLLAKNTATNKILRSSYTQLSSPFNIDGSFQPDGYWNYGKWNGSLESIPAKAVISATYEYSGRTFTVENTHLTGDPAKLGPAAINSDLKDEVTVGEDLAYSVKTIANRYASELVRVKATVLQGSAEDFSLKYKEIQDGKYYPLPFNEGVAWFGPAAGFPLLDVASDFQINFAKEGTYSFKLEIVRISDNAVLGTATNQIIVKAAE